MTTVIDSAVTRLQYIADSVTGVNFAPIYPISDASVLPMAIAHIVEGTGSPDDATQVRLLYTIAVDFHVSLINLKNSYQQIDAIIPEFHRKLAGDPTLNGTVDTINFPVSCAVAPAEWNSTTTLACRFLVPIKALTTPLVTT